MKLPKNAQLWAPAYLKDRLRRHANHRPAKRLWVALTDHFEPFVAGRVELPQAHARLDPWEQRWPAIAAAAPKDANGHPPRFTFFYPQEEYHPEILARLAALTHTTGTTDVEIHLHHFNDNAGSFVQKIETFKRQLHENHGLLHTHDDRLAFGFIHGNWALDNSHPTGWGCGVTGELQLLRDLGCYADFTMPSVPSPTQSRIVNQIYWTTGDPSRPRGFDTGIEATVGGGQRGDLLMITGPTGLRFRERLMPRLEAGELAHYDPPTAYRVDRWLALAPRLGDDIFLKVFGHSAREDNAAALLGTGPINATMNTATNPHQPGTLADMFRWIAAAARRENLELHWASAYEMFRAADELIHAGQANGQTLALPNPAQPNPTPSSPSSPAQAPDLLSFPKEICVSPDAANQAPQTHPAADQPEPTLP